MRFASTATDLAERLVRGAATLRDLPDGEGRTAAKAERLDALAEVLAGPRGLGGVLVEVEAALASPPIWLGERQAVDLVADWMYGYGIAVTGWPKLC